MVHNELWTEQRAVKAALAHEKSLALSDNQIAKHCGVAVQTVSTWRKKLSLGNLKIDTRTVTRGNTTYQQNTANIGRKSEPTKLVADAKTETTKRT